MLLCHQSEQGVIVHDAHSRNQMAHMLAYFAGRLSVLLIVAASLGATAVPSYGSTPVTDYNCPNDNSNNGHYVPANHYWEQEFTSQGTSITGGFLLLGANIGDHDHTAMIGIYTGTNRSGVLEEIEQQVVGYSGVNFTFPTPIAVSPGQQLHIAATGVGDFTAYDEFTNGVDGCFIGRIDGYAASSAEQPTPSTEQPPPPTEQPAPPSQGTESNISPAVSRFSRSGAVTWADNHVNSRTRFKDDCTDFVSMAWTHGGGLRQQGWWYFHEIIPTIPVVHYNVRNFAYDPAWAAAQNFAEAMTAHGWVTRTNITDLSVKTVPGAQPGDVILWHDREGAKTFWSHTALIAGNAAHGLTLIDQHTNARYHTTWNQVWRNASANEKRDLRAQLLHVRTG
jgi:Putative amidase domain